MGAFDVFGGVLPLKLCPFFPSFSVAFYCLFSLKKGEQRTISNFYESNARGMNEFIVTI